MFLDGEPVAGAEVLSARDQDFCLYFGHLRRLCGQIGAALLDILLICTQDLRISASITFNLNSILLIGQDYTIAAAFSFMHF